MTNEKQAQITIPCHWDRDTISKITDRNLAESEMKVAETYGVLPSGGPVGHGRIPESVAQISSEDAINFRKFCEQKGLEFVYLLNAPFEFTNDQQRLELDNYLDWILHEFKPDGLTIASLPLMKYIRERDPNIEIHASTIAGIRNATELQKFLDVKPTRVVPHHDCGKNWKDLESLVDLAHKNNMEVEMLSTESCLLGCKNREAHYKHVGSKATDSAFHTTCNATKIMQPREFLLAGGIIRPEDTGFFEEMGIDYFKISGRAKPSHWLPEVVEAYQKRRYDGNLIRLLGIDPSLKSEDWINIDNRALEGFIQNYPQDGGRRAEEMYADQWITRMYKEGTFSVSDGTEYEIVDESLRIKKPGENSEPIIMREFGKPR